MKKNSLILLFIILVNSSCTKNWSDVYQASSGYEKHTIIQQLAEQGDARAQYVLHQHYLRGEQVAQNLETAERWLQVAANNGNADAQYSLALRYNTINEHYPVDHALAGNWLKRAAKQGHINAQYELGEHYHRGVGMQKDLVLSYIWLTLASRHNNFVAIRARSLLVDEMTDEQLAYAKQNIGQYLEKYSDPFE